MKFFAVLSVFVLALLALASALPFSPDHDILMNGPCTNCVIVQGHKTSTRKPPPKVRHDEYEIRRGFFDHKIDDVDEMDED